ncbi:MAG TPA: TIGR03435 family protein [Terracidiphilus sp.]|nr:TIGR03435 family protein [Terracidiphilus sp.]
MKTESRLDNLRLDKRYTCSAMFSRSFLAIPFVFLAMSLPPAHAQQFASAAAVEKPPSFEVASIKPSRPDDTSQDWDDSPGRLSIENYTLRRIVQSAYGLKSESQVLGGPKWIDKEHFDITAKADDVETEKMRSLNGEGWVHERSLMLQSLLAERFQLKASRSTRNLSVNALIVARSGIRFQPSAPTEARRGLTVHNGHLTAIGISMESLANFLTGQSENGNRVVLNRTGLTGNYDFKMDWTLDRGNGIPADARYPGLFTALQEQLGLKLESQKGTVPVVTIDAASEPVLDE